MKGATFKRLAAGWLAAVVALSGWSAQAQSRSIGRIKDFKWADFYEADELRAGQTNRLKTLIVGAEAVPQAEGRVLVTDVRIESYGRDGRTNLITAAPESVIDQGTREAFSAGPLFLETGDGRFSTAGEGFLCRLTNLSITISNAVRTVVRQMPGQTFAGLALTGGGGTNASLGVEPPIVVTARRLQFDRESNRVLYREDVQVENSQLEMQCGQLRLQLETNGALQGIVADDGVRARSRQDGNRAQGHRAIYQAAAGRESLQLIGEAEWSDGARSGRAEMMTFRPPLNTLEAVRGAVLRLPRGAVRELARRPGGVPEGAEGGGLGDGGVEGLTNAMVEVRSEFMTVQLPTTNQPYRTVVARTNVMILSAADRSRATGAEASYDERSGVLTLSGGAEWQDDQRRMRAERLTYDRVRNRFRAIEQAYLAMSVASLGRPGSLGGEAGVGGSGADQVIEVNCHEFDYQEEWLTFRREVRGRLLERTNLLGRLAGETVALKFRSNRVERVEMRGNVRGEQLPQGAASERRVGRVVQCEWLEADLQPGGYLEQVTARTNFVAQQREWAPFRTSPAVGILAADAFRAEFLPGTNAVGYAEARGRVEARYEEKAARGEQSVYTATNDLLVLEGRAELDLGLGVVVRSPSFRLHPFQRWLEQGEVGPFGVPILPAPQAVRRGAAGD